MNPWSWLAAPLFCALGGWLISPVSATSEPPAKAWQSCLAGLAPQAARAGVGRVSYRRLTTGLSLDPEVLQALNHQPEFNLPIWDYLAALVDQERVDDGRRAMRQWAAALTQDQRRYGVDPAVVVAVWGVESNYGRLQGKRPLLRSLATLSCAGRRQHYFRGEFFAALRIVQQGDIASSRLYGSWAGAFGQTQFMPSTFERIAVDGDGDGRRDLVDDVPDALASTAHYLQLAHWRRGEPWGFEVKLPTGYRTTVSGRGERRSLAYWRAQGIRRIDGGSLPAGGGTAALWRPAGANGPAFLTLANFEAIYRYNASFCYTLAIALLADRLKGGRGLITPWPTDDPGTSRAQRRELQRLLIARGYALGEPDGMIGDKTRQAIKSEQRRLGLPADGRAGQRILHVLESVRDRPQASGRP